MSFPTVLKYLNGYEGINSPHILQLKYSLKSSKMALVHLIKYFKRILFTIYSSILHIPVLRDMALIS